jgi:hypothetical protein
MSASFISLVGTKNLTIVAHIFYWQDPMTASAPSTSENVKHHRCSICNILYDNIETLNAHNRMEHSEDRHSPAGVS